MKKHLNTVYVTTQGTYLAVEGEAMLAKLDDRPVSRVPLHMIEGVVCFGRVGVSPYLMARCAERSIGISLLTERGRFLARVEGPVSGNVLLRREQFRRADDPATCGQLARAIVVAKIANSRAVIQRSLRDHPEVVGHDALEGAVRSLARSMRALGAAVSAERARGIEGEAAQAYFSVFDHLLVAQKDAFRFQGRMRRPPTDAVNALLSFVYTLLAHDVTSALEAVGLDPQVGFLHRDRPGRPGLALDLMEEFRSLLADRVVLTLVNRRQVRSGGFETTETGAVVMDDETRRTVLAVYQGRKREAIRHPFLDESTTVGMLPHLQSRLLARFLRGDLDGYPPFVWK